MPGGVYDSSKTRVTPLFDQLQAKDGDWVRQLLALPHFGYGTAVAEALDLTFVRGYWGGSERGLMPPVSLLSWLIRNLSPPTDGSNVDENRARLIARDPNTIAQALSLLRIGGPAKGWHVLEGQTYPDAVLETRDAIIVVEGKRTEAGPTTKTKWMAGRHQIWRHLDAAWEIRGRRSLFGLFLVEGLYPNATDVPAVWQDAARLTLNQGSIETSLPHRGALERHQLAQTFLGVATWQRACSIFGLDAKSLPNAVPVSTPNSPAGAPR